MTSGSDDFFLTLNVWSFKLRHVELGTFEIPVVGGVIDVPSFNLIEGQIKELQGVVPNTPPPPPAENDEKSPGRIGLSFFDISELKTYMQCNDSLTNFEFRL